METANKSGNEEVSSQVGAFVAFEKEIRWFKVQKEYSSMQLFMLKK